MKNANWTLVAALTALLLAVVPSTSFAQDAAEGDAAATEAAKTDEATTTETKAEEAKTEGASEEAEEEVAETEEDGETKESAHGSYEWKASYGGGLEFGFWFTGLDRWNAYILEENSLEPLIDISTLWNLDFYAEASVLEGTRFSIFGGLQQPFGGDHKISSFYVGLEPAFAFRRDFWELAIGIGAGLGSVNLELASSETMKGSLVVLRPFLEVRRYLGEFAAVYGRFGFNEWLVDNPEFSEGIEFDINDNNLNEGGPYFSLGVRFGHYPEHVKNVGDSDGDGMRDDVDSCPEEAEDFDKFEDEDGCPEADNDKDGILDDADKCPLEPEDKDGWMDEDGCPETDDDADGDGFLNPDDQCPNDPEDKDGFQDDDGCPDPDNDNDGIPDTADNCPMKPGVKAKQGCPFELVEVTVDKIVIKDKIFFEYNKAVIKSESFGLLDQVAETINGFPRIKLIEIGGHTDHAGTAKYNEKLSGDRAKSVYDYLVGKGVDAARLQSKGYGFQKPLVPLPADGKETEEGAAKNRRVEFNILEQEELKQMIREDKLGSTGAKTSISNPTGMKPATPPAEEKAEEKPAEEKTE